ncbi:hypothetical protein [Absidia glauca]|uniref:RRM domain-containing protein n=1 Tax=Absidia glauca TaxID=4829 RepID=A0A163JPF8_ABSGL|nr:hypothetical protein [Absidia glauca]
MSTISNEKEDKKASNLSFSTDKDALRQYFEAAGKVTQATVIRRSKLRSAGYGFVTYETSDEAEKAAETLDTTKLDGRNISVQIARPKASKKPTTPSPSAEKPTPTKRRSVTRPTTASNTRIFVANLPYATTDDELAALFSDFTIESASIARLRNGRSKGYGFVDVASETEQQTIINGFQPVTLAEREVSVKVALVPVNVDAAADQVKQDEEGAQ